MENGRGSGTALMTAYIRGYHALYDDARIFDDSVGYRLIPEEIRMALEGHLKKTAAVMANQPAGDLDEAAALRLAVRVMAGSIVSRARYIEDRLFEAMEHNDVRQYVILGAGLDSFAFRRPDLQNALQIFEVDHQDTQKTKRLALQASNLIEPANLHYIPVDFTSESLSVALKRSSFDPRLPSFFSWAGVTHYLPIDVINDTLSDIVSFTAASSEITFDYWDSDAFDPVKASSRVRSLIETSKSLNEPIITGFDPDQLGVQLNDLGLRLLENLGPEEIRKRYDLDSLGYFTSMHVHFACAEVI